MKWSDLTQYGYKDEEEHSFLPMGDEAEFLQEAAEKAHWKTLFHLFH